MYWGPHISWCMQLVWWSSAWETSGVQVNWDCWSSYKVALLLSFFQLFPNSATGLSCFCPLVWCKYLHLTLSAACWVFRSAVMLGPFLWALQNLRDSVRPWDLPLSWIPLWACGWTFFFPGFSPFPSLQFFQTGTNMGDVLTVGWQPPPSFDVLSSCLR